MLRKPEAEAAAAASALVSLPRTASLFPSRHKQTNTYTATTFGQASRHMTHQCLASQIARPFRGKGELTSSRDMAWLGARVSRRNSIRLTRVQLGPLIWTIVICKPTRFNYFHSSTNNCGPASHMRESFPSQSVPEASPACLFAQSLATITILNTCALSWSL